jgi:hypothetical protein
LVEQKSKQTEPKPMSLPFNHLSYKNIRILNAIKEYKIGMPLTMSQFDNLSPKVVIDRLLQRRLFALASKMCQFMQIQGEFKS